MSDLDARLRSIAEHLPDPDDDATAAARRAMHDARTTAPWATGRRRSWFSSRRPRPYLLATAIALLVTGGALAATHWSVGDLPPFGNADREAFALPATDILPGGYERTRPPTFADLPERPSLLFPAGVGYTEALVRYAAARSEGEILPPGVALADPLPAGKVVMVRSDGRIVLDPAAPFGYSATTGLVTTLSVPFDGSAMQIARCQLLIGAADPESPACDRPGVRGAYVREGVAGRWIPSPNEEELFDQNLPASTELSVIDDPSTPLVRISAIGLPLVEGGSGADRSRAVGRLVLRTRDVRLIVVPADRDRLCFVVEERMTSGFHCGPRSTFLSRGAVVSGGRSMGGPFRLSGLVGDGIERVVADDGTVARVVHNGFTLVPSDAARRLTFSGPIGSFSLPITRASDEPSRFRPDRSKERELVGIDLAAGGHASIRVAPNIGGGRCDWFYILGTPRSNRCTRPGDPPLPYDVVTGGFSPGGRGYPFVYSGPFAPVVGAVEMEFADGATERLTLTDGFVLHEIPPAHITRGRWPVAVTTFDRDGVPLVRNRIRDFAQIVRQQRGTP